jgi:uncharacterized protein YkwD
MKTQTFINIVAKIAIVAAFAFGAFIVPLTAKADWRADQVLALVNAERKKRGLKPLALSNRCQAQASKRAKEIAQKGRFNHKGAFRGLRGYFRMGENIARGYGSPKAVVRGWMRSKGHRANILSPRYKHLGVGYYKGRWVQTFGGGSSVRRVYKKKRK